MSNPLIASETEWSVAEALGGDIYDAKIFYAAPDIHVEPFTASTGLQFLIFRGMADEAGADVLPFAVEVSPDFVLAKVRAAVGELGP